MTLSQEMRSVVIKRKKDKRAWKPLWPWNPFVPHVTCPVCREPLDQKQLKREGSYHAIVDGIRFDAHIDCIEGELLAIDGDAQVFGIDYGDHFY